MASTYKDKVLGFSPDEDGHEIMSGLVQKTVYSTADDSQWKDIDDEFAASLQDDPIVENSPWPRLNLFRRIARCL